MSKTEVYKVLIVEDEVHAQKHLQRLINKHFNSLKVIEICTDTEETKQTWKNEKPDIVFLDVNLGKNSGLDVLNEVNTSISAVIFTTAFSNYAIHAFKFGAVDFLHKPFSLSELEKSIDKALLFLKTQNPSKKYQHSKIIRTRANTNNRLILPSSAGITLLDQDSIIYCEADGAYTTVISIDRERIYSSKSIGTIQNLVDPNQFFRVHQSFLVNITYILEITKGRNPKAYLSGEHYIPISERRKKDLLTFIERLRS